MSENEQQAAVGAAAHNEQLNKTYFSALKWLHIREAVQTETFIIQYVSIVLS